VKITLPNGPRADHAGIDLLAVVVDDMSRFLIAPVRQLIAPRPHCLAYLA
jgi:hypothetical protein